MPLARRVSHVDAIEAHAYAIRDLRHNLKWAQITNVNATGGDVTRQLPACHADMIVVDPPRASLARDVVKQLSASQAKTIAYVSCDPATLARDLARFSARQAYFCPITSRRSTFSQRRITWRRWCCCHEKSR